MPFIRCLALTSVLCIAPLAATAQTTASQASAQSAPVQAPRTQDVTVAEPNMDALKPPARPAMTQPHWSEFPKAPKNVPSVADFAGRVHKEQADSAALDAIGRTIVWETYQPDAIQADANARIDPSKLAPVDPELTPAQTEALAQTLRAQVTPPPVAQ